MIGPPLKDRSVPDIRVFSVSAAPRLEAAIASHGGQIVARSGDEILIELPIATELADIGKEAGASVRDARQLGGFFQPIRFVAERTD